MNKQPIPSMNKIKDDLARKHHILSTIFTLEKQQFLKNCQDESSKKSEEARIDATVKAEESTYSRLRNIF
jgi:hypothetical protein